MKSTRSAPRSVRFQDKNYNVDEVDWVEFVDEVNEVVKSDVINNLNIEDERGRLDY